MTPIENRIILFRAEGETYKKIGEKYGLSAGRIRALHQEALRKQALDVDQADIPFPDRDPTKLPFSKKTCEALRMLDVRSIKSLVKKSPYELLNTRGFTRRILAEIEYYLRRNGTALDENSRPVLYNASYREGYEAGWKACRARIKQVVNEVPSKAP